MRDTIRKVIISVILVFSWNFVTLPASWVNLRHLPKVNIVYAADTGFVLPGTNAAVTSGAGDNNGFQTTTGNSPADYTTSNDGYSRDTNSGSGVATDGCGTFPQSEDDQHDYFNFGFTIPAGATINGVEVLIESSVDSTSGTNIICVATSWNAGSNWSTAKSTSDLILDDITNNLGGSSDTWGRSWSASEFSNSNFRLRLMPDSSGSNSRDYDLDLLQVKVYYTADTTAPTPNPMTFASSPSNDSATQISMTATTASDSTSPINYLFTNDNGSCASNSGTGGTSSSWQSGTNYSDSGLDPNKCYGYTVTARDSAGTPNSGSASSASISYTSANTPGTPTLTGATISTLNLTNDANSNPSSNPTTNFAVQVVTTTPTDSTWLNKWIDGSGDPSDSAVWLTDSQLDSLVLSGLNAGTLYGVQVKAKNQDGDETSLSPEGQGTTSSATISVTITTDQAISYGTLAAGVNKSTIDLSDTQTAQNDGNVAEDFNIKTSSATGGTTWNLGSSAGADIFVHEFSTNSGGLWTKFTLADTYSSTPLATNVSAGGTQSFDLRITVPTSSSDYNQKTIVVTVQAVQH